MKKKTKYKRKKVLFTELLMQQFPLQLAVPSKILAQDGSFMNHWTSSDGYF